MLKTRVLTAVLLLAVFLPALFWLPQAYWALLMALVAAVAAWEWGGLAGLQARGRLAFGALVLGICAALHYSSPASSILFMMHDPMPGEATFALLPYIEFTNVPVGLAYTFGMLALLLFWGLALPFWLWRRWRPGKVVLLGLGVFLICATWQAFVDWRKISPWALLAVMGIAWVADISAYFAGRKFGGRKLAPNISPGKTWAGVWGALAGVAVYSAVLGVLDNPLRDALPGQATEAALLLMFVFLALAALGILGDLFESLLKRQAGVKDSGNVLPGHGGVLDRIDSLMAILPCANALSLLFLIFFWR
ncbi:MAG: phosphatidate cytidylyltransferase [Zoogloeaceae bacterium]|jgi:phosphatidate cytidylyltransferase|nr:phosphatidate cytidylyltransferase [Zoogloeaceae bacterium]